MATSIIKQTYDDMLVRIANNTYIGKHIMGVKNKQLTFTQGIATWDISNWVSSSEAFGFFFFPYNADEIGVMHIVVNDGIAKFNSETTTLSGDRYVDLLILFP